MRECQPARSQRASLRLSRRLCTRRGTTETGRGRRHRLATYLGLPAAHASGQQANGVSESRQIEPCTNTALEGAYEEANVCGRLIAIKAARLRRAYGVDACRRLAADSQPKDSNAAAVTAAFSEPEFTSPGSTG